MSRKKKSKGGFGCSTVIQIIFILLKLFNVVGWSWNFVFAPTYISLFGGILGIAIMLAVNAWHNK
jgi:hypothetical protein